jgi:phosphoglycolate phosphatase
MDKVSQDVLLVDLDGTLTDPAEGIVGSFRIGVEAVGRTAPPAPELTWIIGPPLRESFAVMLGEGADVEAALSVYRQSYGTTGLFEAAVYAGVPEALARLKAEGVRLFLCTSKPIVYARRVLAHFGLAGFFESAYGSELDGRFDDKGQLIGHILEERGLDAGDCVMWGDRRHDVAAARKHGIPTIGALWGYGGEAELVAAGAALLCASPDEVPTAFAKLARERAALRSAAQ